jgi:hypothetical protein
MVCNGATFTFFVFVFMWFNQEISQLINTAASDGMVNEMEKIRTGQSEPGILSPYLLGGSE